jgi:hypothetical protein
MTSTELERLIREKLEAAGLLRALDEYKSQFLEFPDGLFAELVLNDGSKLVDVERVGRELRESLQRQGVDLDVIVRAIWTIESIEDLRPWIDISEGIRLASVFPVTLVSGGATTRVEVAMAPPVVLGIRNKLLNSSAKSLDEIAVMKEVVREFLNLELALGGESYWDPKRYPRRELNEAALDYLFLNSAVGKK